MTDNEIIKAFKGFLIEQVDGYTDHVETGGERYEFIEKELELLKETDNLINRQQAKLDEAEDTIQFADKELKKANTEIERLEAEIDKQYEIAEANVRAEIASGGTSCHWCEDKVRAEAYKEFAERLKEKSKQGKGYLGNVYHSVDVAEIDNLLKEMVGGN